MIKMIVFDWDGVIVDTLGLVMHIHHQIRKEIKHYPHMDDLCEFLKHHSHDGDMLRLDWKNHYKELGVKDEEEIKMISKIFFDQSIILRDKIKLFPGMKEVLLELKKKYKLAILSNSYEEIIRNKLRDNDIEELFDFVGGADHGEKAMKPEPEYMLNFLNKVDLRPRDIAFVGDMDGDIIMGNEVGVLTIATSYGYHSCEKLKFHNPDHMIDKPEDLLKVL